jgi:cytochrome c556
MASGNSCIPGAYRKEKAMKSTVLCSVMVLAAAVGAGPVLAQVKPETLVKQRQAVMTLHGKYLGPLARMAQGRQPYDANIAARNAAFLDTLGKMPWDAFDPSTREAKSNALPAVFSEPAKFKEAQDRYQAEVAKLVAATKGGDEGAIKAQIGSVAKACNACHDNFTKQ